MFSRVAVSSFVANVICGYWRRVFLRNKTFDVFISSTDTEKCFRNELQIGFFSIFIFELMKEVDDCAS